MILPLRSPHARLVVRACLLACALALPWSSRAVAQTGRTDFAVTNGNISTSLLSGGTLYVGGSFTYAGPQTGGGVEVDSTTGAARAGFPLVNGTVSAVAGDGGNGWYIGGLFNTVGGTPRANLAHVLADYSLAPWNPGADGQVNALVVSGGLVYVGGAFANAGGAARARIAAVDTSTGTATAWNPGANDIVRALTLSGTNLYVAGRFTSTGGATRNRIAALNTTTALATSWNPNSGSEVLALARGAGKVYAGGTFTTIGTRSRNRIAELDSVTGIASSWNPNANNQVNALALGSGSIYAGGTFTTIGVASRTRLAEISLATGAATAWAPNPGAAVNAVALDGSSLYAGGDFVTISGEARSRLAEVNVATGLATPWNPVAFGSVLALSPSRPGVVFAGGSFAAIGGVPRNNVVAINAATGAVLPWDADVNGQVLALADHGGVLYMGGQFTTVSGQLRTNAAAVDLQTAALRPWAPTASDVVTAIAANDTSVYLGGLFTTVGFQSRSFLAQVDASAGAATAWNPSPDGQVFQIQLADGLAYIGGSFSFVGATARTNLAAVNPVSGAVSSWNPNPNGTIRSIVLNCDKAFVAGFFTTIGGQNRSRIAALDLVGGLAASWNPNANGQVFDMRLADGVLYAGGLFTVIGGQNRLRIAALDPTTGLATAWNPTPNGSVVVLAAGSGQVFAGGTFTAVGSTPIANVVAVGADVTFSCPTVAITPAILPDGAAGTAYSQALSASGGTAPRCWSLTEGSLPPGLAFSSAGVISGIPMATVASSFTVTTTDARGCASSGTISLTTFGAPITSVVAPDASGLCVNPAHPFVALPLVFTRTDATPVRLVSVTFHLDTSHLALRTPATPGASVHLGSWLGAYPNTLLQVQDIGGGSYTADATVLGEPCGPVTGGQVLTVDVAATGADGFGTVSVTTVRVRDCANALVAVGPGAPASVRILFAPLAIAPATLPGAVVGSSYHQALVASGGTAPYTFALLSGGPPPGVTLAPSGVLDGAPTLAGTHAFSVGVTDSFGSVGQRAYSIMVECPVFTVAPSALPDGLVGAPYSATCAASGAAAPLAWTISAGSLPNGLALNPTSGEIAGTPAVPGTSPITVSFTDANGCSGNRAYAFTMFSPPVMATLAADASGLCLSRAHTRVLLPFVLSRADTFTTRMLRVTFQLDATRLALATPAAPESSLHVGSWFTGFPAPTLVASSEGSGAWTVELAIPAGPCGPADGGQVFTADVVAAGPGGAATIGVDRVKLLGCAGDTLPVFPGAVATLAVDGNGVATLVATAVPSGNGAGATTGIALAWLGGSPTLNLYRASWASYPTYASIAAPDSALAPGAPWTLVASGVSSPYVDHPDTRGFWYYVAMSSDPCGNLSFASNRTGGALDYLLGDVSDGVTPGTGNNRVDLEDVTLLGANYGITGATIVARGVEYLDLGPTSDLAITSRPVPDGRIDFDDLMLFSSNFERAVTAPAAAGLATRAQAASGAPERFQLEGPSLVSPGDEFAVPLRLAAGGRMQGFSVLLGWNPAVVEPLGMRSGGFAEDQGGLALPCGPGRVDAALLGRRDPGFSGEGVVATFRFRALRSGDAALRIAQVRGRDTANRPLPAEALAEIAAVDAPRQTLLLASAPNPFTASVALSFALAQAGDAELAIYDLNGRHVRTLVRGRLEAGIHRIAWDGRDDAHASVAPGVFYVRFAAAERSYTSRLIHLR